MNNILLGALGEQQAARFLRKEGYNIWGANFKTDVGEIDIVAEVNDVVCFVEVKTRKIGGMVSPSEAVDFKKQENVKSCAAAYINKYNLKNEIRFDIIEILVDGNKLSSINHIKNAF